MPSDGEPAHGSDHQEERITPDECVEDTQQRQVLERRANLGRGLLHDHSEQEDQDEQIPRTENHQDHPPEAAMSAWGS